MAHSPRILVLGATSQVAKLIRASPGKVLGENAVWHSRNPSAENVSWDLSEHLPSEVSIDAIFHLAGGRTCSAQEECDLVTTVVEFAKLCGEIPLFYASSQAVYPLMQQPVSEANLPNPTSQYGLAKSEAEKVALGYERAVCLRIGNVAGADSLFLSMNRGPVVLDQFADGCGPNRSYVGPATLGMIVSKLTIQMLKSDLEPRIINLANQGTVAMSDILKAAGMCWDWVEADSAATQSIELDVGLLASKLELNAVNANELVKEATAAGWEVKR